MKLILAIINDEDSFAVMDKINENGFQVTKLASTGGFLKAGNTSIICGVEATKVDLVFDIIRENCKKRKRVVPQAITTDFFTDTVPMANEITVGGATVFVLDVEQFLKL